MNNNSQEDFNWDAIDQKGFGVEYSEQERSEMEAMYNGTLNEVNERDVLEATVVRIVDRDVILNVGFKSDGLVPVSEFRDLPDLKVGDTVEVYVETQEDAQGQIILSRRKAKILTAWKKIQAALDEDIVIEGTVKRRTKGGLIVDIYGIEAFLPGSQIDVKPIRDFDIYVGKNMEVKVIKINYSNDNVVVSHKVLIEKDLEEQKIQILNNLEKGQVLEGTIKNMTNFGVFIDLGGVDGLLHITDISWGRINHPEEVLNLDEKVNIVVLDFDDDKKRISLGMKQLTEHPWESLSAEIEVGSVVKGMVRNLTSFGLFIELEEGIDGLVHVSDLSWTRKIKHPSEFIKVGEELEVTVLELDVENKRLALGHKQLEENPWDTFETIFTLGSTHDCTLLNRNDKGAQLELPYGIEGYCPGKELTKEDGTEAKVGEKLPFAVIEFSKDEKRIVLSHVKTYYNEEETTSNKGETTTLGDLEELSALKEKIEEPDNN